MRPSQFISWESARWIVGIVLLTAGVFKIHELVTLPMTGSRLFGSRWLLAGVVDIEVFVAIWLFSNLWRSVAWLTAVAAFGAFALISLVSVITGAESCGCFGRVSPPPVYMLILDIALIALLRFSRPPIAAFGEHIPRRRAASAIICWVCLVASVTAAVARSSPDTLENDGRIRGGSGMVVLQPNDWLGKTFPLREHIEIGADLSAGDWIIFFHQHRCGVCQAFLPRYIELAERLHARQSSLRVAFVEVPPVAAPSALHVKPDGNPAWGKLNEQVRWFMRTPAVVRSSNGTVTALEDPEFLILHQEKL